MVKKGELQTRRNRKRMGRPDISLRRPRRWNRPIPEGILPAYDEALRLIRVDARRVRADAARQRREVLRVHKVLSTPDEVQGEKKRELEADLEKMRAKLEILEVQSEVNLPDVRWSVANAMADMSIPSHRHLVEQRWRKDGDLDLLMERIHQMHVVPDVLPVLHPTLDLHVTARLMPEHFDTLMNRNRFQRRVNTFKQVVPGNYLTPRQTRVPPKLYANVFHTDVRLYTMLLVDPDVPDEVNQTYTTFLHWLKPNIPLSATHTGRIPLLNTHTRYIPPHPQRGTPYHRYVMLLLPQPPLTGHQYTRNTEALLTAQQARLDQSLRDRAAAAEPVVQAVTAAIKTHGRGRKQHPTHPNAALPHPAAPEDPLANIVTLSQRLGMPVIPDSARLGFNVRAFARHWGLNGAVGGGVHMWREVWDKYVGGIYKYDLHRSQPIYGRPPRHDPQRERHSAPTRQKYRLDA
ncbi:phosphatidylethanolamine-binding protein [Mycena epipterygia]|nr:phosphatidylethanolamine-binding protein [Mycena epipterygia]